MVRAQDGRYVKWMEDLDDYIRYEYFESVEEKRKAEEKCFDKISVIREPDETEQLRWTALQSYFVDSPYEYFSLSAFMLTDVRLYSACYVDGQFLISSSPLSGCWYYDLSLESPNNDWDSVAFSFERVMFFVHNKCAEFVNELKATLAKLGIPKLDIDDLLKELRR